MKEEIRFRCWYQIQIQRRCCIACWEPKDKNVIKQHYIEFIECSLDTDNPFTGLLLPREILYTHRKKKTI